MNVRDLGVTIKANIKGLDNLKAFNNELKATLGLIKRIKNTKFNLQKATEEASKSLSETESTESSSNNEGRKSGRVGLLLFLKNLKSAPIIASLIYIGRAVIDVTKKVASLVISLSQVSYETLKLSRNLGVSTDSLQRFGNLAVAQGVKLSDFQSAISSLRKMSADIMLGRGDISPFAILGINPHQDPEKILIQLQQRLKQLPEAVGTAFASDLGLSPDMINFIRRTDFGRLARQPRLSGGELRSLEDMRGNLLEFYNLISIMAQKVLADFKPVIDEIINPISSFLKKAMVDIYKLKLITVGSLLAISAGIALVNPALGALLAGLTTIGVLVEDFVKTGGNGIIGWLELIGIKIGKMFANLGNSIMEVLTKPLALLHSLVFDNPVSKLIKASDSPLDFGKNVIGSLISGSTINPRMLEFDPRGYRSIGARSTEANVNVNGVFVLKDSYEKTISELKIDSTNTTVSGVAP